MIEDVVTGKYDAGHVDSVSVNKHENVIMLSPITEQITHQDVYLDADVLLRCKKILL